MKKNSISMKNLNNSGATALVAIIIDKMCFIGNIGESRAIVTYTTSGLTVPYQITHPHNVDDELEFKRIRKCKGKIVYSEKEK